MLTQNLNTHWLTPNAKLAQFLQSQLTMDLSMGMSQLRLVFVFPGVFSQTVSRPEKK